MTNCKHMTNERTCGLKSNAYRHRCYGEDKCRHCKPMTNAGQTLIIQACRFGAGASRRILTISS